MRPQKKRVADLSGGTIGSYFALIERSFFEKILFKAARSKTESSIRKWAGPHTGGILFD
jgi:hypothetical protein